MSAGGLARRSWWWWWWSGVRGERRVGVVVLVVVVVRVVRVTLAPVVWLAGCGCLFETTLAAGGGTLGAWGYDVFGHPCCLGAGNTGPKMGWVFAGLS